MNAGLRWEPHWVPWENRGHVLSFDKARFDQGIRSKIFNNAPAGLLLSYSNVLAEQMRGEAGYVDRILKGTRPSDLPVQQPTRFEFAVNLNRALGAGETAPSGTQPLNALALLWQLIWSRIKALVHRSR